MKAGKHAEEEEESPAFKLVLNLPRIGRSLGSSLAFLGGMTGPDLRLLDSYSCYLFTVLSINRENLPPQI